MRTEILLNDNWLFHKGEIEVKKLVNKAPVYNQSKTERKLIGPAAYKYFDVPNPYVCNCEYKDDVWEYVQLPHDYIIGQDNTESENNAHGYFHYDNAWYRKHFRLPENCEGKRIVLRFDGIAGHSTVHLNGCLMYHNFSSYNTFEVDISDNVFYDRDNVIAIYVNTEEFEGWWYQGGGIYRDVHLTISEPVCIDLWGVYAPYKKIDDNTWQINYETAVLNTGYENCEVEVESSLLDKNGNIVVSAIGSGFVNKKDKSNITYSAFVKNPLLWDCDNPNLYTIKTVLKKNNEIIDENTTRIGFRTIEISVKNGLLLNGKKTFINGVCAHQDFGLTGLAVPENIAKYKVSLMKEIADNGFINGQKTRFVMDRGYRTAKAIRKQLSALE